MSALGKSTEYFAATDPDRIGDELMGKVDKYFAYLGANSLAELWRRSYRQYYGLSTQTAGGFDVGDLISTGEQGEIAKVKVNHLRNLVQHGLTLTTAQRPEMQCRAINSDASSLAQAYLGNGIIDFFMREKRLGRALKNATESALVMGEGWIVLDWNVRAGREYGVGPNGQPVFDGDVEWTTFTPFDVIRDVSKPSADNPDWLIFRSRKNRFDLAAQATEKGNQELAQRLMDLSTESKDGRSYSNPTRLISQLNQGLTETDDVDVFSFFHRPTPALPNGRFVVLCDADTVVFDGALPFRSIPAYRVAAMEIIGAPFGWTTAFDLIGIQIIVDKLYSIVTSNQLATGLQNFWSPPGNEVTTTALAGGLNLIESAIKPEALQLTSTPAEVFNFIQMLEKAMETLSGINSVARGNPEQSLKSGAALALVASQAVQFNSGLENSYNDLTESTGSGLIHILQDYAATPRMAVIAGKFNRPLMRMFSGDQLKNIDRVVVDATSSISKTTAGKMQIADTLLQNGLVKTSQEYITLINTGKLEPLLESEMSEIILVRQESEDLRDGKSCSVLATDDHKLHVLEHRAILANPDSRRDPKLVQAVLGHIQEHINQLNQLQQTNPGLLALLQEQPIPSAQPPQGPQPGAAPGPAQTMDTTNPVVQAAQSVKKPGMPNLPPGSPPQAQQAYDQMKTPA